MVMLLLLLLRIVLSHRSDDSSAYGAQEPMADLLPSEMSGNTTTDSAQQATICLCHRWRAWVIVGGIGLGGLAGEFMVCTLGLCAHSALVCLILCVGGIATVLLGLLLAVLLRLLLAVVVLMTLRVGSIILAIGDALLAVDEAPRDRRTK